MIRAWWRRRRRPDRPDLAALIDQFLETAPKPVQREPQEGMLLSANPTLASNPWTRVDVRLAGHVETHAVPVEQFVHAAVGTGCLCGPHVLDMGGVVNVVHYALDPNHEDVTPPEWFG